MGMLWPLIFCVGCLFGKSNDNDDVNVEWNSDDRDDASSTTYGGPAEGSDTETSEDEADADTDADADEWRSSACEERIEVRGIDR